MGVDNSLQVDRAGEFDTWHAAHGQAERELWVIILMKNTLLFRSEPKPRFSLATA